MITLGELRSDVRDLLHLGTTGAEPSDPQLLGYVVQACQEAWGELPPVFEGEFELDDSREALIEDFLRILYVQSGTELLVDHEWGRTAGGIRTRGEQAGGDGDTVFVWYTKTLDLTGATQATEFESSCIFGPDWLRQYVTMLAARKASLFQVRVGGGGGAATHGAIYRVTADDVLQIYTRLSAVWGQWNQMFLEKRGLRLQFVRPLSYHGAGGLRTIGKLRNPLFE